MFVVHNYLVSQSDPKHSAWAGNSLSAEDSPLLSAVRVKTMLGSPGGEEADPESVLRVQQGRYGLGDRRTLDQAIQFAGEVPGRSVARMHKCCLFFNPHSPPNFFLCL